MLAPSPSLAALVGAIRRAALLAHGAMIVSPHVCTIILAAELSSWQRLRLALAEGGRVLDADARPSALLAARTVLPHSYLGLVTDVNAQMRAKLCGRRRRRERQDGDQCKQRQRLHKLLWVIAGL